MARRGLLKTVQFPDDLSNRFQAHVKDAIETITADNDIVSAPVLTLQVSGPIAPGRSIVAYQGTPGATLTLPSASSQGANTALAVLFANKSAGAVTLQPAAPNTVNGTTSLSVAAGALVVLVSDGQNRWLTLSPFGPLTGDVTTVGNVATLANIPTGTPAAGSIILTQVGTPSAPPAGKSKIWADNVSGNLFINLGTGAPFNHGILTKAAVASQWIRSIADDGSSVLSQPSFADLTGTAVIGVQRIAASGTYTATAGTKSQIVEGWGSGGGGGGTTSVAASTATGGGGGSGGYFRRKYAIAGGGTGTVAIGVAGAAGAATGGTGGTGGNTTFTDGTTLCTAFGGLGGVGMTGGQPKASAGGAGGAISTNGTVNATGAPGAPGLSLAATIGASGNGASCLVGGGGVGSTAQGAGAAGLGNGSGGAGGTTINGGAAVTGGAGTVGVVVITEYA